MQLLPTQSTYMKVQSDCTWLCYSPWSPDPLSGFISSQVACYIVNYSCKALQAAVFRLYTSPRRVLLHQSRSRSPKSKMQRQKHSQFALTGYSRSSLYNSIAHAGIAYMIYGGFKYDEILLTPLHIRKPVKLIAIAYILPLDVYTQDTGLPLQFLFST